VEALSGDQEVVSKMVGEFRKRRNIIVDLLNDIPGIKCLLPEGAFYVFPNVSAIYGRFYEGKKISGSVELIDYLLDKANVAAVPGGAFGSDDHIRLSYATSLKNIEEGLKRIKSAIARLE
jgi:aspartate aminotransferase